MNNVRKAFDAGATVHRLVPVDAEGKKLGQLVNPKRQAKNKLKAAGLSGRQIKRLLREARRTQRPAPGDDDGQTE